MSNYEPGKTAYSRVFITRGGAGPENAPSYKSCVVAGALAKSYGDVTKIECPDPHRYGQFVEIGQIQGAEERATLPLTGRYPADFASTLLEIAELRCAVDLQVHFGACKDPSIFNEFTKAVVLEDLYFTNYSTEDLGALSSDANAAINESVDTSAKSIYEILPIAFAERATDIITTEVVAGVICGPATCGECGEEDDGCGHAYFVTLSAGGSPAIAADIVHTITKGANWSGDDVDSLGAAEDPTGVACLGNYIVVISNDSNSLHYALKAEVDDLDFDELWTENGTGFVPNGEPNGIWSVGHYAFIVGDTGYIYGCEDPTVGVTVLDAGVASSGDTLRAVHALSETFAVAVGGNGVVVGTQDGITWTTINHVTGVGITLWCVWCKNEDEWWVGASNGSMYYTEDGGANWIEKGFTGSAAGNVYSIQFATKSVGYMAHTTAAGVGRIFRTYNGGYSWRIVPERAGIVIPANNGINIVAACPEDVNFVIAGGLAADGTDGILLVGAD